MSVISTKDIEGILNVSISVWTRFSTKTLKECIAYILKEYKFDNQFINECISKTEETINDWSLSIGGFGMRLSYNHRSIPNQTDLILLGLLYNESFESAKRKKIIS